MRMSQLFHQVGLHVDRKVFDLKQHELRRGPYKYLVDPQPAIVEVEPLPEDFTEQTASEKYELLEARVNALAAANAKLIQALEAHGLLKTELNEG